MTQVFTGPPTIINPLVDQLIAFNTKVTLSCDAKGNGTITYQWQKYNNGEWINIKDKIKFKYTTSRLRKSTQFSCVVSNEAGETTSNVTISVLSENVHCMFCMLLCLLSQRLPLILKTN